MLFLHLRINNAPGMNLVTYIYNMLGLWMPSEYAVSSEIGF
jgi:hypothetical protein